MDSKGRHLILSQLLVHSIVVFDWLFSGPDSELAVVELDPAPILYNVKTKQLKSLII